MTRLFAFLGCKLNNTSHDLILLAEKLDFRLVTGIVNFIKWLRILWFKLVIL